jgi:hypothetical protein
VSGRINARVVDRLSRFGLRWIPWGDDANALEQSIATMRERIAAAGVSPDPLQVVSNLRVFKDDDGAIDAERTLERVPELVEAGATDFLARVPARDANPETEADLRAFVAAFRAATGHAEAS